MDDLTRLAKRAHSEATFIRGKLGGVHWPALVWADCNALRSVAENLLQCVEAMAMVAHERESDRFGGQQPPDESRKLYNDDDLQEGNS